MLIIDQTGNGGFAPKLAIPATITLPLKRTQTRRIE